MLRNCVVPPFPARSSQHSSPPIYPLSPLINYFSLSCLCVLTNKRNSLSLSTQFKKKERKRNEREFFETTWRVQLLFNRVMEKRLQKRRIDRERRSKDRRSKEMCKDAGVDRPPHVSRTLIFIRPWQVYTDCIFHFEAIAGAAANAG